MASAEWGQSRADKARFEYRGMTAMGTSEPVQSVVVSSYSYAYLLVYCSGTDESLMQGWHLAFCEACARVPQMSPFIGALYDQDKHCMQTCYSLATVYQWRRLLDIDYALALSHTVRTSTYSRHAVKTPGLSKLCTDPSIPAL